MLKALPVARFMASKLVGLVGPAGVGKDYTYEILKSSFPEAKRASFAEPLKNMLLATDPIVDERGRRLSELLQNSTLDELKRDVPEVRRLLQKMGTEGVRECLGRDVFLDAAMSKCGDGMTIFTDVRFENEAREIRRRGGIIVRVEREGTSSTSSHESESAFENIKCDYVFENDGREEKVRSLAGFIFGFFRVRDILCDA